MDSKEVNKAIGKGIKPLLKDAGFAACGARTFRRYRADRVEVVNFQSFNSYLAEGAGCTTFSFALNLGIFFLCVPHQHIKEKNGLLEPEEYHCHFRKRVMKGLEQWQLPRKDTYYVAPDGSNLDAVIEDAARGLKQVALPWFEKCQDEEIVLGMLLEGDESTNDTWGMGNNPSPMRSYLTGFIAKSLGRRDTALTALKQVIDGGIMRDSYVDQAYAEVLAFSGA